MSIKFLFLLLILINCKKSESCNLTQNYTENLVAPYIRKRNKCIFCSRGIDIRIDMGPGYHAGGWNNFTAWVISNRTGKGSAKVYTTNERLDSDSWIYPAFKRVAPIHDVERLVKSVSPHRSYSSSIIFIPGKHKDKFHPYLIWVLESTSNSLIIYANTKTYVQFDPILIPHCYDQLCMDGYFRVASKTCKKCDDGYFGFNCSGKCFCKNLKLCDRYNGSCGKDNCPIDRTGEKCDIICPINTFGPGCKHKCFCKHNVSCDIHTGKCPAGCAANYYGKSCRHACLYGDNCLKTCKCVSGERCDEKTGKCPSGTCNARYYGTYCRKTCKPYTYGTSCTRSCHCLLKDQCHIMTGICLKGGCIKGWFGKRCDIECPNRQLYCQQVCRCRNISDCIKSNYYCPSGCDNRFYGPNCKYQCPDNKYVINGTCSGKCHCVNMRSCNVTSGDCGLEGCRSGYTGTSCDKTFQSDASLIHPVFWVSTALFGVLSCLTIGNLICKFFNRNRKRKYKTKKYRKKEPKIENIE